MTHVTLFVDLIKEDSKTQRIKDFDKTNNIDKLKSIIEKRFNIKKNQNYTMMTTDKETNIDYELRFNEDIEDLYNKQKIKIEFIKTNKIGQYS